MNLHLYWIDKNWKEKGAAENFNLIVDTENKLYRTYTNSYYGYNSPGSIEVKRKSDITDYIEYLKADNFIEQKEPLDKLIENANRRETNNSKKEERYILWSDINMDFMSWMDGLREEYPDLSEDSLYEMMYKLNNDELKAARNKLNIVLSQPIIMISDVGLGDIRISGSSTFNTGNIKDCLYNYRTGVQHSEWYVDKAGDLRHTEILDTGVNYNLYRVIKETASNEEINELRNKLYTGDFTRADIEKVTDRLGDKIAEVYGWNLSKNKNTVEHTR